MRAQHSLKKRLLLIYAIIFGVVFIFSPLILSETITFSGDFSHKQAMVFKEGVRLKKAVLFGQARSTAYLDGFSIERNSQKKIQATYKKFLLKNISMLAEFSPVAKKLYHSLLSMPVTGRMMIKKNLDDVLIIDQVNPLLMPGDNLYLPKLPHFVSLFGWAGNKKLQYHSGYMVIDYLKDIKYGSLAEKNYVYVISPAGRVRRVNVAYWNHSNARISPGAIIYVPLSKPYKKRLVPHFNLKLAQFLSTQRIF